MQTKCVLIVDDEASVRTSLEKALSKAGYVTKSAGSGNEALKMLQKQSVDIVLSDLKMPDGDGLDLIRGIKMKNTGVEVILLTGFGTVDKAVEAMKEGAYDFITKPFKKAVILSTIERAIDRQSLAQEKRMIPSSVKARRYGMCWRW